MNKPEEIIAYKAFFKGLTNNIDGIQYEIGKPILQQINYSIKEVAIICVSNLKIVINF